jgi:cation transporter-like permease
MTDRDSLLLESVRVHRSRLSSALVFGPPEARRSVGDNIKRFIGSVVVAAIVCAVCVAVSFVTSILAQQQRDADRQTSSLVVIDPLLGAGPEAQENHA